MLGTVQDTTKHKCNGLHFRTRTCLPHYTLSNFCSMALPVPPQQCG